MNILGISAFYHDSAAALVCHGEIVAAAQEERFSRKKHDHRFPIQAVEYCLSEANITASQLDYIIFYHNSCCHSLNHDLNRVVILLEHSSQTR